MQFAQPVAWPATPAQPASMAVKGAAQVPRGSVVAGRAAPVQPALATAEPAAAVQPVSVLAAPAAPVQLAPAPPAPAPSGSSMGASNEPKTGTEVRSASREAGHSVRRGRPPPHSGCGGGRPCRGARNPAAPGAPLPPSIATVVAHSSTGHAAQPSPSAAASDGSALQPAVAVGDPLPVATASEPRAQLAVANPAGLPTVAAEDPEAQPAPAPGVAVDVLALPGVVQPAPAQPTPRVPPATEAAPSGVAHQLARRWCRSPMARLAAA